MTDLRRTRRVRRVGDVTWGDAAYRVYVTALAGAFVAYTASGWVGDSALAVDDVATLMSDGASWAGLLAAIGLLIAVRSGARGGPMALEAADVHHLLLAPVDRRAVLAKPALRLVGQAALAGALAGALVGELISQRLPDGAFGWMLAMGTFGAVTSAASVAIGLITAGGVLPSRVMVIGAWLLTAWAIADLAGAGVTAPTTVVGRIGFWVNHFDVLTTIPLVALPALVVAAWLSIGGLSVDAALRRTVLVGQLRFAVTQQDLRTVLVLRRQLAAEIPRTSTWFRVPRGRLARRFPILARDLHSVARWPGVRIVRVTALGAGAGLAMCGVWSGTTPLVLVAGVANYVAALDAIEPLAQELDHPTRLASFPIDQGEILLRHLVQPVLMMVLVGAAALVAALVAAPAQLTVEMGAIMLLPAAGAAVAGAAVSVAGESTLDPAGERLIPPEVAGPRVLFRAAWPPAIAVLGLVPLVFAHRAELDGNDPLPVLVNTSAFILVLVAVVFAWVRFRGALHQMMAEAAGGQTR